MHSNEESDFGAYPILAAARAYSLQILARARADLATGLANFEQIATVAFGGSLGRLEAHGDSDIDCIIVARRDAMPDELGREVSDLLGILDGLGLRPAAASGIYRQAVDIAMLTTENAQGSLTEPADVFGKRMQILLDARPVWNDKAFDILRHDVIAWYGHRFLELDPRRSWTLLINDLMRYLHAYAGWQQFRFESDGQDSWHLRQAKFRSTRLITFAALIFLLGVSNARADKCAWLGQRLQLAPLARLGYVMRLYDNGAHLRLLKAYESTQAALADSGRRRDLRESAEIVGLFQPNAMQEAERQIISVLTCFLLDRRADWDPRFFERLIF